MLDLMDRAKAQGCDLIVYPELALTTFFPRWFMEDQDEIDVWFEREMPGAATRPLFERAAGHGMAMSFGYAELTPEGRIVLSCCRAPGGRRSQPGRLQAISMTLIDCGP
jgi:predicted amidohydrolase